jgi:aspartate carbamoyltransferase
LSFESAALRLGGKIIHATEMDSSSLSKGETLEDTARVISTYADVLVVRHPEVGSVEKMAQTSLVPVINAGDGSGEHPTQAILDMFTIQREKKNIDGLTIALVGDLKYGRTVHSLSHFFLSYKIKLHLVSPPELAMPTEIVEMLKSKGVEVEIFDDLLAGVKDADVLYDTRIQKERFADMGVYEKLKNVYRIDKKLLDACKKDMIVMHPLPRVGEIDPAIDSLPQAKYFQQVANGVAVRMALLGLVTGRIQ